jgi:outer membrane protein assembly factor BamA
MTSKQLERKVGQLYSRKKLVETVEGLEETIKAFMLIEAKTEIHTEKFIINLVDGRLDISVRTSIDLNQLTFNFKKRPNPKYKEELTDESIDPQETITGRTRPGQRRRVQTLRPSDSERREDHRRRRQSLSLHD